MKSNPFSSFCRTEQRGRLASSSSPKHQSESLSVSSSSSDTQHTEHDIYHSQNNDLWANIRLTQGNTSTLILAVVAPDQIKPMKRIIDEKAKENKIQSSVVVTTQEQLQQQLRCVNNSGAEKPHKSLHLLVSSTVSKLTYHIEDFVDQVSVKSCGSARRRDALYISASSTYCGWPTYAWSHRPQEARFQKQLTHSEDCLFDLSDVSPQELSYLSQSKEQPKLSDEGRRDAAAQTESPKDDVITEHSDENVQSTTDHVNSWFQQWKRLLATILETGANARGFGIISGVWMGSDGLIVKGLFGIYIAAGYTSFGIKGYRSIVGSLSVGTSMVTYDQVFLISWDRIWEHFTNLLENIWGFTWIMNKITELSCWLVSFFI
ncbi:unnamed protein product [Fusarium graminearum]|uniref:Uncharacterized protein n=1 Tax=Gibberella zeae TaxID=5518 RepID=A0A679PHQ4_GIBZA|nr:hypothetical protein FG05_30440 [Fusarium graminearum]KAI6753718.1 hypothetical protein HG531_005887 [Fusarium graminearum]CZS79593.1 unnamed protein product [Fusarium graminearum]